MASELNSGNARGSGKDQAHVPSDLIRSAIKSARGCATPYSSDDYVRGLHAGLAVIEATVGGYLGTKACVDCFRDAEFCSISDNKWRCRECFDKERAQWFSPAVTRSSGNVGAMRRKA